jgi:hypothetical protein
MKRAIASGHLDVVKYFFAENTTFSLPSMMKEAAMHGHVHIIQWLYEMYGPYVFMTFESGPADGWANRTAMDLAANCGHLHVLKYLHSIASTVAANGESKGPACSEWALPMASAHGHLEIVKWLHDNYPEQCYPRRTTKITAQSGNFAVDS